MTSLTAIGLCLLSAFEISLSPDQPLPYSYTDDPLIVEIRSDVPCTASIQLTATPDYAQAPREAHFESIALGPETSRWCALKDMSTIRGPWEVTVTVTVDDVVETLSATAYRIDRPGGQFAHPVYAYGSALDRNTLLALRSVAIETIRIPLKHPELSTLLDTLRSLGMRADIQLPATPAALEEAQSLALHYCDVLAAWTLEASLGGASTTDALQGLRALMCQLPVHIQLPPGHWSDGDLLAASQGQQLIFEGSPESLAELRERLSLQGLPSRRVDVVLPALAGTEPQQLLPRYFEYVAQGAHAIAIPATAIYADGAIQPGLAQLNGLMHRIPPSIPAGRIVQPGTTRLRVFAAGTHWLATAWRSDDTSTVALPWSNAHPFSILDAWGNGLENTPGQSTWTHPLSNGFLYVTGLGGPVLRTALVQRATEEAKRALDTEGAKLVWSETLSKTLNTIAGDPAGVSSRVEFFTLLRAFPEIEERWHAGQLTRPMALAALDRLATLARTLCQLEAVLGASFLEPLQDTLARCDEFQSAYLTGTTDSPQAEARGDWLVAEIRRLMDEVDALVAADQKIEADAVAALAEWRARGLEFAAKAGPLSDQLSLPEPEPEPEPEVVEEPKKPVAKKKSTRKK